MPASNPRLLVLVLATLTLMTGAAGCIGTDDAQADAPEEADGEGDTLAIEDPSDEANPERSQEVEQSPDGNVSTGDWFTASIRADSPANVTGFEWTVPDGAVTTPEWRDDPTVVLEAYLDAEDPSALTKFGLLFFDLEGSNAAPLATVSRAPAHVDGGLGPLSDETSIEVEPSGFVTYLGFDDLSEGDKVGIVLAAETSKPIDVDIAFTAMEEAPSSGYELPDSIDDVEARTDAEAPIRLAPTNSGEGFHVASFLDWGSLVNGFTYQTDDMDVQDDRPADLRPVASLAANTQLASNAGVSEGWSWALGSYGAQSGVGEWSLEADVHGATVSEEGYYADARGTAAGTASMLAFGMPLFMILEEGEGASEASMQMDRSAEDEFISMTHVNIGITVRALFDVSSRTDTLTFPGLVEPGDDQALTRLHHDDTGLTMTSPDHATVTVLGP